MKRLSGSGFVIDKTRIGDNKLIIKVLDNSDQHFSAILRKGKTIKSSPEYLDSIDFVVTANPKASLGFFSELTILPSFRTVSKSEKKLDFYYFIADLIRSIGNRVEIESGLYQLIVKYHHELKADLRPDFLVSFLIDLLNVFGVLPTMVEGANFLDFREGSFVMQLPKHPDFCEAQLILASPYFSNENSDQNIQWNAKLRFELLYNLIRYFEFQKGISVPIKSIDILRELR